MKRLINKNSAKQVGIIYHYTNLCRLIGILNDNTIEGSYSVIGDCSNVSFTRNQNFHNIDHDILGLSCRLVIDGNKLSNNYKIKPYHDTHNIKDEDFGTEQMEQEERVNGDIFPIKPYIISIDLTNEVCNEWPEKFDFDNVLDELNNFLKSYDNKLNCNLFLNKLQEFLELRYNIQVNIIN